MADYPRVQETVQVPLGALDADDAYLRVTVSSNALVLAGNDAVGVGVLDLPRGAGQNVVPRQVGKSMLMVADGELAAFDPVYAKASGKVGDLTAAEPLVGYALQAASGNGAVIEVLMA